MILCKKPPVLEAYLYDCLHFKKAYSCLRVGSIVPICYRDHSLDFEVLAINEVTHDSDSGNSLVYSLIETEVELVVDTPYDSDYVCS